MIHWKLVIMLGSRDHSNPLVYAVEFDSESAATAAAEFYMAGGYTVLVIKDDETADVEVEPGPGPEPSTDAQPVVAAVA